MGLRSPLYNETQIKFTDLTELLIKLKNERKRAILKVWILCPRHTCTHREILHQIFMQSSLQCIYACIHIMVQHIINYINISKYFIKWNNRTLMTCYLVIPPKIITYFYSSLQRQMKTIAKVKNRERSYHHCFKYGPILLLWAETTVSWKTRVILFCTQIKPILVILADIIHSNFKWIFNLKIGYNSIKVLNIYRYPYVF